MFVKLKTLMCAICLLSFIATSHAQRFSGGLVLGVNASQVDGDTYSGYNKFGIMGGVFAYTPLSNKIDLQMEIKYMGKGAHKKTTEQDLYQYKSILNYIEIPLILRLNTKIKLGWEAGLGFGYLFSYAEKDENGKLPDDGSTSFKPFELSSIIGALYKLSEKFQVNLRYSYSIFTIVDKNFSLPTGVADNFRGGRGVYNNLFSLGVYYTIGNKK
jgi:hypothetical protein